MDRANRLEQKTAKKRGHEFLSELHFGGNTFFVTDGAGELVIYTHREECVKNLWRIW